MTLYAAWSDLRNASYKVEHYRQNADLQTYSLIEAEINPGAANTHTVALPKQYTGFSAKAFAQERIRDDNSTVIKIYYDRDACAVRFDANGGEGKMEDQIFHYDVEDKIKNNEFKRYGYAFTGWSLDKNADVIYQDGDNAGFTENKTLYAKWSCGLEVEADQIPELDLSSFHDDYAITIKGEISQFTLVQIAEKISSAPAKITLDLSKTSGLKSISPTSDSKSVFADCSNLVSVILPDSLTTIGSYAFSYTKIKNIFIPASVKTIGTEAFSWSSISSVDLKGLETVGDRAFYFCKNIKTASLKKVNTVGSSLFAGSSLQTLVMENIDTVSYSICHLCKSLSEVRIKNISSLGTGAFASCSGLKILEIGNSPSINSNAFSGGSSLTTVRISNVDQIGESSFSGCRELETLSLSNVSSIEKSAFADCESLKSVSISNCSVIDEEAFINCLSLSSITLDAESCSIGARSFKNCKALSTVNLRNLTSLGENSFEGCTGLTQASVDAVTIKEGVFKNCTVLTDVRLGAHVAALENSGQEQNRVFEACPVLTSVVFLSDGNWCYASGNSFFSLDVSNAATNAYNLKAEWSGGNKWLRK